MISIKNKYSLLFILSVFVFQTAIILYPGWREDDVALFLIRLKYNLFGNAIDGFSLDNPSDRFMPFYYFGYQLISFFTLKPFFFFLYNLFLSLSTLILLQIIRIKLKLKYWPVFIFLVFVPGYADSFYQIVNPEKELIFFWCLFLFTIMTLLDNESNKHRSILLMFISFPLIIFSLFLKETTFIILSTFCSSFLVLNSKILSLSTQKIQINTKVKYIFYSGLMLSLSFLVLFFIFTSSVPDNESSHYLLTPADNIVTKFIFSVKALILYAITDSLLVLLLPLLFFYSVYQRVALSKDIFSENRIRYSTFIDACAITALSLVAAYIVLGFHGFRYLLPAYPFGLIALAAYLQIYVPSIKNNFKKPYIFVPSVFLVILLINSIFSAINLAVFYKVSSYNFMHYKDVLLKNVKNINSNNNKLVNVYIPGKSNMWMIYSVDRHKDLFSFYEIDVAQINFEYSTTNDNWVEQSEIAFNEPNLKKGDILLILPNSTISQDEILSNLRGLRLREIIHTQSPNYFEIPEIRHLLKYIMLKINPTLLGTRMVSREVDYAIYEVL
jgi:hypothetical protein